MENRLIFLSMAAIDENRAKENRWLPDQLFPLVTHRIADGIVVETNSAILTKSSNVFEGMFTEDTILEKSIALRIRYYMQRNKISKAKLAKAVGCSRDTIYRYENGMVPEGNMSIEILKKIADYFEVDQYLYLSFQ